jgi:hypothetical protein
MLMDTVSRDAGPNSPASTLTEAPQSTAKMNIREQ